MKIFKKIYEYCFCMFCKKMEHRNWFYKDEDESCIKRYNEDKESDEKTDYCKKKYYKILAENGEIPNKEDTPEHLMLCESCINKLNLLFEEQQEPEEFFIQEYGCEHCIRKFQKEACEALLADPNFIKQNPYFDRERLWAEDVITSWICKNKIIPYIKNSFEIVEKKYK